MATVTGDVKQRFKAQYDDAAAAWDRRFDWYMQAFGPLDEWFCRATRLAPGQTALDVACGTGMPALAEARLVAPAGRVIAIDISREMIARGARRAANAGLGNIEFREGDAERLAFEPGSFDAVSCSHGLMFFPDAIGALKEMRRVLKPGGRLAVAAWDQPQLSPFITLAGMSVAKYFPPTPPDPKSPGVFRFSAPGALATALADAGFKNIAVEAIVMPIPFASVDEYWAVFTDMAAGIKDKINALSKEDQAGLRKLVADGAQAYTVNGQLTLTATPLCATAVA